MRCTILVILFAACVLCSSSRSTFNYHRDFQTILARTKNPEDSLSYNKLLERFNQNDTTLNWHEVLALMIGFTAQPAYQPYKDIETEISLHTIKQEGKFKEALNAANLFLVTHPLSMQALNEKIAAFKILQEPDSAKYYLVQLKQITNAMMLSGNGKTPNTARFALGPGDGEHLLYYTGVAIAEVNSAYDSNGDLLDVVQTKLEFGATAPFYFIIQHAKEKMYAGFSKAEIEKMKKEERKKK